MPSFKNFESVKKIWYKKIWRFYSKGFKGFIEKSFECLDLYGASRDWLGLHSALWKFDGASWCFSMGFHEASVSSTMLHRNYGVFMDLLKFLNLAFRNIPCVTTISESEGGRDLWLKILLCHQATEIYLTVIVRQHHLIAKGEVKMASWARLSWQRPLGVSRLSTPPPLSKQKLFFNSILLFTFNQNTRASMTTSALYIMQHGAASPAK